MLQNGWGFYSTLAFTHLFVPSLIYPCTSYYHLSSIARCYYDVRLSPSVAFTLMVVYFAAKDNISLNVP